jgi:hypothetical protein
MNNTIIYLIGHYGVGKLTVAKAICAVTDARLFDNHLANNVIFSLVRADGSTPLPEGVWPLIMTIRRQALSAIVRLAAPEASFVLTNALLDDDPMDRQALDEVIEAARQRGSVFVPVFMTASDAAHAARIPSPEREFRLKSTNVSKAEHKRRTRELIRLDHPNRLDLDTTDLPPSEAARLIIEHAERLA